MENTYSAYHSRWLSKARLIETSKASAQRLYPPLVSIESRSTEPRSFFYSGEDHHCTHREVARAKSSQVTPGNRESCGSRSGRDFDPFCEIWGFERHLCCRSCIFEEVCTAADILASVAKRRCFFQSLPPGGAVSLVRLLLKHGAVADLASLYCLGR